MFQELGFEYEITWEHFTTACQQDAFLDAWIALIESRDLVLVGGPTSGFICGRQKNPTRSDINAIQHFLSNRPRIQQHVIGKLVHAWYGAYDGADPVLSADICDYIPTYDEVDPTPPVMPRIEMRRTRQRASLLRTASICNKGKAR